MKNLFSLKNRFIRESTPDPKIVYDFCDETIEDIIQVNPKLKTLMDKLDLEVESIRKLKKL